VLAQSLLGQESITLPDLLACIKCMSSCGTCRKEGRKEGSPAAGHEISLMIRESVNVLIPEVKATRNLEYYYNSDSAGGGV
jgi:hypothetical protein